MEKRSTIKEQLDFVDKIVNDSMDTYIEIHGHAPWTGRKFVDATTGEEVCVNASPIEMAFRASALIGGTVCCATEIPYVPKGVATWSDLLDVAALPYLNVKRLSDPAIKDKPLAALVRITNEHMDPLALAYLCEEFFMTRVALLSSPTRTGVRYYLWMNPGQSQPTGHNPKGRYSVDKVGDLANYDLTDCSPQGNRRYHNDGDQRDAEDRRMDARRLEARVSSNEHYMG